MIAPIKAPYAQLLAAKCIIDVSYGHFAYKFIDCSLIGSRLPPLN
jgi:hypothetical protein